MVGLSSDGTINFVVADKSPFLIDNPQFKLNELVDRESGRIIDEIGHLLQIRCEAGFDVDGSQNQANCEDPSKSNLCISDDLRIIVKPSTLQLYIYATDSHNNKELIFNHKYITDEKTVQYGKQETLTFQRLPVILVVKVPLLLKRLTLTQENY